MKREENGIEKVLESEVAVGGEEEVYNVSEAPDVESIDDLLDELDEVEVSGEEIDMYEEIEPVEEEHFRVSTKKLADALKLSSNVSQGTGRDKVSRSVGIGVSGNLLTVYMSDSEIYAEKLIPVMNDDNLFEGYLSVNHVDISKAIKVCPTSTVIYKKDGKFFIKLIGGDMEIEDIGVDKADMSLPDKQDFDDESLLPTKDFSMVLRDLFPLASSSASAAQRRIFFDGNKAYAVYLYSIVEYESDYSFPTMDISVKNVKSLYPLTMGSEGEEIKVLKQKSKGSRVLVVGDNFSYSFPLSKFGLTGQMVSSMGSILGEPKVNVDYGHLNKVTDLSSDLVHSISRMDFNYTDEGKVQCLLKTKKSDVDFLLVGIESDEVKRFGKPVSIQTTLIKTVLKVFSQETVVSLGLSKDGVGIESGRYRAVLYREGQ